MKKAFGFLATGVALTALAQAAHAQQGAPVVAEADIPDIIVTGQKRAENVQNVSAAVTVLSGTEFANKGVVRLDDIQTVAPSLSITNAGLTQSVNIRGVGIASGSGAVVNGVATYYDGLFQPPIVTTNSFYDIKNVEVFRGPQGTFVGSNSTGGAIFISSNDPNTNSIGGYLQGELANYNRRALQGAINIPVTQTLAIRAAGNFRRRDSFYTELTPGLSAPAKLDEKGGRVGVIWSPGTHFSNLLKFESDTKDTGGYAVRPYPFSRYASFRTSDPFRLNYSSATANYERATQLSNKMEYHTDGGVTLRSVTGYENKRINSIYDVDGTSPTVQYGSPPNQYQEQYVRQQNWIEEVNILSPTGNKVSWIIGGYYQHDHIDIHNDTYTLTISAAGPAPAVYNLSYPISDTLSFNSKYTTGLFAQGTVQISPRLSVDVGGRYSWYTVQASGAQTRIFAATTTLAADLTGHYHDSQFTGKAAINWRPTHDQLIYAFVAKGYKSGGSINATTNFAPEKVIDYEAGWKGTFANGHLMTQFGGFYYDYQNFQIDALNPLTGTNLVKNLPKAKIKGFEGQVQARFGDLHLSSGFGYVDSSLASSSVIDARAYAFDHPGATTFGQCAIGVAPHGGTGGCSDYSGAFPGDTNYTISTGGGPNLYSPKWTWNIEADYDFNIDAVKVTPHLVLSHLGSRFTYYAYNNKRDLLPAYTLINASVTFAVRKVKIDVWATNLSDKLYTTGQSNSGGEFYGNPREFGARVRIDF